MQRHFAAYGRQVREAARIVVLLVVPGLGINKLIDPASGMTIFGPSFWEWFAIWLMPAASAFTLFLALIFWGAGEVDALIARHKNK